MCITPRDREREEGPVGTLNQISKILLHSSLPWWPGSSDSSRAYHWKQEPINMNNGNNLVIKAIHKLTSKALNRKLIFQTWVFTMSSYPMLISATSTFSKIERYKVKNKNTHTHTQRERERERERENLRNHNKLLVWWLWHWMHQFIQKLDWSFIFIFLSILQIHAERSQDYVIPRKIFAKSNMINLLLDQI
jgi:hypothetical protein